ncbi:MAG: transposase [Rhodospirillaceae bacterium]|nr:transposase [Rhodospirillaceae bacterium]
MGEVLLALLGRPVSASTVSRVAKTLDAAVAAFHGRPLANRYKSLMLDGVVLARKTGAGALRRPVLVALGIRPDDKKEVIDFRLAPGESAAAWEGFLTDLYRRGLTGEGLEVICADGGQGLLATLPMVYPAIPVQRCWAGLLKNPVLAGGLRRIMRLQPRRAYFGRRCRDGPVAGLERRSGRSRCPTERPRGRRRAA